MCILRLCVSVRSPRLLFRMPGGAWRPVSLPAAIGHYDGYAKLVRHHAAVEAGALLGHLLSATEYACFRVFYHESMRNLLRARWPYVHYPLENIMLPFAYRIFARWS